MLAATDAGAAAGMLSPAAVSGVADGRSAAVADGSATPNALPGVTGGNADGAVVTVAISGAGGNAICESLSSAGGAETGTDDAVGSTGGAVGKDGSAVCSADVSLALWPKGTGVADTMEVARCTLKRGVEDRACDV